MRQSSHEVKELYCVISLISSLLLFPEVHFSLSEQFPGPQMSPACFVLSGHLMFQSRRQWNEW